MNTTTTEFEPVQADDLIDQGPRHGSGLDSPHAIPPTPWSRPAGSDREDRPSSQDRALLRLLAMADAYLRSNELHQALEMYFELMSEHPETAVAEQAEDRILDVARQHEQAGELRQARAIYERLV
ncbi:tetratricopeptide repeat protein (plasmid) [Tundrisphaera lichenicola]|uniref:tetratricopeptide repeat protein n=1 Tax=Tundrisphaera lichenicola TaxID=2029860 RepID=UPI003EC066C1